MNWSSETGKGYLEERVLDKKLIVVVDTDEEYLAPLEYKLIEEWGEKADIEIITQLKYYNEFFSQPRNIFLLIVNEYLYSEKLQKQNCSHVFVLRESEQEGFGSTEDKRSRYLYKYSSVKEIYAEIMKEIRMDMKQMVVDNTRLYVVYSSCGGCGKTIAGLGISSALSDLGKRIVYINMEPFQDFNCYLEDRSYASPSFGYALAACEHDVAFRMLPELGKEEFDYLKPFENILLSYQIQEESYLNLVERIKEMRKYDAIVLELSRDLSRVKLQIMEKADKIINICTQSEDSAFKIEKMLKNINWSREQWMFICGRYKKNEENYLGNQVSLGMYNVTEYVEERELPLGLKEIRKYGIFDTTAYLLE